MSASGESPALSPAGSVSDGAAAPNAAMLRLRRLHSLSGVVPLGVFLVEHIVTNARAVAGQDAFVAAKLATLGSRVWPVVEVLFILVPLLFHAIFGLHRTFSAKEKAAESALTPRSRTILRISGIVALVFILVHLYEYRVARLAFGLRLEDSYSTLASRLSTTDAVGISWLAVGYIVGLGATVLHFALGTYGYALSFPRFLTMRSALAVSCGGLGALLFLLGGMTVVHFATGSFFFFAIPPTPGISNAPCPEPATAPPPLASSAPAAPASASK